MFCQLKFVRPCLSVLGLHASPVVFETSEYRLLSVTHTSQCRLANMAIESDWKALFDDCRSISAQPTMHDTYVYIGLSYRLICATWRSNHLHLYTGKATPSFTLVPRIASSLPASQRGSRVHISWDHYIEHEMVTHLKGTWQGLIDPNFKGLAKLLRNEPSTQASGEPVKSLFMDNHQLLP